LIGINSEIITTTGGNVGIGFAIPSNMARTVMNQLIKTGKVQRGMLGVEVQNVTSELAAGLGLKQVRGILVSGVTPGGPADKAGLKAGDVILELNGTDVNDPNTLRNEIAATAPGSQITLTINRNGTQQQVQATVGELTPEAARAAARGGQSAQDLGLTVTPMTPGTAQQLGLPASTQGLAVESVDPSGPAAEAGIQAGDVIEQVNRTKVTSADDLRKALAASANRPPVLLINRGGQTIFTAVPQQ
jgi:serine protease Do